MKKHKNVVIFLIRFFATYFILFALYASYLQQSQQREGAFKTASLTTMVADQTVVLLDFLDYNSGAYQHKKELSVKLLVKGKYTARVIEGCNSLSIIILFIAFITKIIELRTPNFSTTVNVGFYLRIGHNHF